MQETISTLEDQIMLALLPKDPLDERNIMLEIRAGAGGDEASIWAGATFCPMDCSPCYHEELARRLSIG